jgi:NADPH:quinone reductase-like Zn-dependent oxidoreductase
MRALRYSAFGPIAEVLRFEELPPPQAGHHEVVVRARYAGINPLDWKLVEGQYRRFAKSRPPCGVGAEFSGEVLRVGARVDSLRVGDRVTAWLNPFAEAPRAMAEEVIVPAAQCVRVPDSVALDVAAVVPVAGLSALQLIEMIDFQPGQRVLVHGAAGGVGSFVVAMLRDRGATVCATGSSRSQDFLRLLQPDAQVDYATAPSSWPGPFDAIVDCASTLDNAAVRVLLPHGGTVVATLPSFPGVIFDPLLNPFRRIRRRTLRLEPSAAQTAQVVAMVDEGRLKVQLTRTYPFEQAVNALAESRSGRARGKLAVALG